MTNSRPEVSCLSITFSMIVIDIFIKVNGHIFRSSAVEAGLTIFVPFSSVYDFPHHPVLSSVQDSRVPTRGHMLRLITYLLLGISFRMGWNRISGIACRVLV